MTEAGLLYSNARIKSMENSLVSPLQMGRLLDCETFSDAVKMLSEFGYTGGTAADDGVSYENLLDAERAAATDFFKENVFKKSGLETMLLPADWHNLKSALKAKYGKVKDLSLLVYQGGNVDLETIEKAVEGDEEAASGLTAEMNETIAATRAEFAENPPSGRFIDVVTDKAMYREIFAILKKSSSPCLVKYFALQVDLLNLKTSIVQRGSASEKRSLEKVLFRAASSRKRCFRRATKRLTRTLQNKSKRSRLNF